jgi:hypothetical protein
VELRSGRYDPRVRGFSTVAALAFMALAASACASPCKRVTDSRKAFLAAAPPADQGGEHARIKIPLQVVDALIAPEVAKLPSPRLALPSISGFSLGKLSVRVDRVLTKPAPEGHIGFKVVTSLRAGKKSILSVDLDTRVRPRIDLEKGEIVLALDEESIRNMKPKLGRGGADAFTSWIWGQLPAAARMLTSKKQISSIARRLADQVLPDLLTLVRRELGDELGELSRVELQLPPLPIAALAVRSTKTDLVLGLRSSLPVMDPLPPGDARNPELHPNLVELDISGAMAAALANDAMARGELPQRYDLEGSPDPEGSLVAGLAWPGGAQPLALHLWNEDDKDCAHVTLRATPRLSVNKKHLLLASRDARIKEVEGPLRVRAGLFFSGVGRRSFSFMEKMASELSFDLGKDEIRARIHDARISGDAIILGLRVRRGG